MPTTPGAVPKTIGVPFPPGYSDEAVVARAKLRQANLRRSGASAGDTLLDVPRRRLGRWWASAPRRFASGALVESSRLAERALCDRVEHLRTAETPLLLDDRSADAQESGGEDTLSCGGEEGGLVRLMQDGPCICRLGLCHRVVGRILLHLPAQSVDRFPGAKNVLRCGAAARKMFVYASKAAGVEVVHGVPDCFWSVRVFGFSGPHDWRPSPQLVVSTCCVPLWIHIAREVMDTARRVRREITNRCKHRDSAGFQGLQWEVIDSKDVPRQLRVSGTTLSCEADEFVPGARSPERAGEAGEHELLAPQDAGIFGWVGQHQVVHDGAGFAPAAEQFDEWGYPYGYAEQWPPPSF